MKKYIHYCWFGGKPLPKLANKCIESWKKFLPDFEIIRWDESNVDLNECPFIKEAYDNKAWAFVADYARTRALKEMGGIYFDTDMEVTKNIDNLLKKGSFLGVEDTGFVNSAVWYEKESNGYISSLLLEKYRSFEHFDNENRSDVAIPKLITEILTDIGFVMNSKCIQELEHNIYIYPRDYFYPYSYNWENNMFTDNTCMIHYFDATWIPLKDRIEINMVRKIGRGRTFKILNSYRKIKIIIRKIAKVILFPIVIYRNYKRKNLKINEKYLNRIENTIESINKYKNSEYIAIHNSDFFGVTSASKELFKYNVDCGELYRKKDIEKVANAILENNIKQIIINAMPIGQDKLAILIKKKNPNVKVKVYWHGSNSQVLDSYGWKGNTEIIKLMKKGIIDCFATCKKSMLNFYLSQGLNACFLTNIVSLDFDVDEKKSKGQKDIRIGLYAAKCDDWRKNMFTQMAAVSLIPNAVIDMVPLNDSAIEFAKVIGVKLDGVKNSLPRKDLIKKMSKNDITMYVTFSECAPMMPLESFEVGVPCITGNNHHYFEGSELEDYLIVNNEENPEEIKNKLLFCLENKDKIFKLYEEFKKKNCEEAEKDVKEFLKR